MTAVNILHPSSHPIELIDDRRSHLTVNPQDVPHQGAFGSPVHASTGTTTWESKAHQPETQEKVLPFEVDEQNRRFYRLEGNQMLMSLVPH